MNPDEPRVDPVLLEAARLIREEGWIQGESHIEGIGYCITGAIAQAAETQTKDITPYSAKKSRRWKISHRAQRRLGESPSALICWNDSPARTKEEVLKRLEDAAIRREVKNEAGGSLELASTTGTAP